MSGIYWIYNKITNDFYIGSAKSFYSRKAGHYSALRRNKHYNTYLQNVYNKYGEENLVFEELITCHPDLLHFYEQQFIDQLQPKYNLTNLATGGRHLGEGKGIQKPRSYSEKLSIRMQGNTLGHREKSPEERKKISQRMLGNTRWLGKKHTEEWKKSMSNKLKGRIFSEETRQKMSESAKLRCAKKKAEMEGSKLCMII